MPRRLLLAAAAAALCLASPAQAATKIQPGAMLKTAVGQCTLNFVFDGIGVNAGRTFIGTAAHCGDKLGDDAKDIDNQVFGQFAFIGDAADTAKDYAFIEVIPSELSRVDPAMKGHAEYPKGVVTPEETAAGDLIQMSGYGIGFGELQATQEGRQTILQSQDADIFTLSGPSVNGDSGGPFVHVTTGKALGVVSQYGFTYASTDVGPTVQGILAKAAQAGFPVALRAAGQAAPAAPKPASESPAPAQPATSAPAERRPATAPAPASKSTSKKAKAKAKACSAKALKKARTARARRAIRRCMQAKRRK